MSLKLVEVSYAGVTESIWLDDEQKYSCDIRRSDDDAIPYLVLLAEDSDCDDSLWSVPILLELYSKEEVKELRNAYFNAIRRHNEAVKE